MSKTAQKISPVKFGVLGLQHVFAMFGATVLVPILTGLPVAATLLFAGLGTWLFHLLTGRKVPAFLGSSFAFLGGYAAVKTAVEGFNASASANLNWIPYAGVGVICAGALYVVVSLLFRAFGAQKIMRFFPPIVTGPIIICIGMSLANSAINNCADNWWIALVAIATVVICNIWGKGMIKIIPILMGVVVSYVVAACCGLVDFSGVADAAWVALPFSMDNTVFSLVGNTNGSLLVSSIICMMPIALATMMEHIGDMCAISSTVGKDFISDPGLHKTLLGDGLATILASAFGAPANTTYGENTGVLALTKVYDPKIVELAATIAVVLSFCPKISALISCMPAATIGGVSLILYGMISAVGVRNIVENKVDFTKSRNVIIAALIMSLALGITFSAAGTLTIDLFYVVAAILVLALVVLLYIAVKGSKNTALIIALAVAPIVIAAVLAGNVFSFSTINLSGLAVASLVGILLNAILPGNDYVFGANEQGDESVNFKV